MDSYIKKHNNLHRQWWADRKNLNGKGPLGHWQWEKVLGSLTSATISMNLESETDKAVVTQCPISFEFSMSRALHCWLNKALSQSNFFQIIIIITDRKCHSLPPVKLIALYKQLDKKNPFTYISINRTLRIVLYHKLNHLANNRIKITKNDRKPKAIF